MQRTNKSKSSGEDISGDGGLTKTIVTAGNGEFIPPNKAAIVHYTGRLMDGTVFDRYVLKYSFAN